MWPKKEIKTGETWEFAGETHPHRRIQIRAIVDDTKIVIRGWFEPSEYSSNQTPRWEYKIEHPYFFAMRESSGDVVSVLPSDDDADKLVKR
jgi:hypothetical protein